MAIRAIPANWMLQGARYMGKAVGAELVVETSDHSLDVSMEVPSRKRRAWDQDMFKSGQLYRKGYANPIKPVVNRTEDMEQMDEIDVEVHTDGGEIVDEEDPHVGILASWRYQEYQDQHLISELVRPEQQWRTLLYVILGVGALVMLNFIITVYISGGF